MTRLTTYNLFYRALLKRVNFVSLKKKVYCKKLLICIPGNLPF